MEGVKMYASPMFGFFETDCSASKYINCVVDRRPPESDYMKRGYKRLTSTTADGFHSKFAVVGPTYIGCTARYNGDDGIAINGHYHIVSKSDGSKNLRIIGKQGMEPNLDIGNEVEIVTYSGKCVLPNPKIMKFEPGSALTSEEREFLDRQQFQGDVKQTKSATMAWHIELDRAIDLPMGSLIAANRIGNGFVIKNCTLGPTRSRGVVIMASNGLVEGNKFYNTWGQSIMVAPSYEWLEAGSGNNIVIKGNQIQLSHDVAIAVYAYGGDGSVAPAGAHNDIYIVNNSITKSSNPAIAGKSEGY